MYHKAIRTLAWVAYDAHRNYSLETMACYDGARQMFSAVFGVFPGVVVNGTVVTITIDGLDYIYDYKTGD